MPESVPRGPGAMALVVLVVVGTVAGVGGVALSPPAGAVDGPSAERSAADAPVVSERTRWRGQTLYFAAANDSAAGEVYQVRRVLGGGRTEFVTEFVLDDQGEATIDTAEFPAGDYVIVDDERNPVRVGADGVSDGPASLDEAAWELVDQSLSAAFTRNAVVQGNATTLVVDSTRGRYPLVVSSEDFGVEALSQLFPDAAPFDASGDGEVDSVRLNATSSTRLSVAVPEDVPAGDYTLEFSVPDATATATANLTVTEKPTVTASFTQIGYDGARGEVIRVGVNLTNADVATIDISSSESDYAARVRVQDGNGDGQVVVAVNTYLAGRVPADEATRAFTTVARADRVVSAERTGGSGPLAVAGYSLAARVDGSTTDTATLILNEQSVSSIATGVAPGSASTSTLERVVDATTIRPRVATGDKLVLRVEASGLSGVLSKGYDLSADSESAAAHGVWVSVTPADGGGGESVLDPSRASLYPDPESDQYYVVFEGDAVSSLTPGKNYTARFVVDDRNPFIADGEQVAVTAEFRVVQRNATFDRSGDEIRVEKPEFGGAANVEGDSTVAPGTQLLVVMRATGNGSLFRTDTVTVSQYSSWRAQFDISNVEAGTEVTLKVRDGSEVISKRVIGVVRESEVGGQTTTTANGDGNQNQNPNRPGGGGGMNIPWTQLGTLLVAIPVLYGGWRVYSNRRGGAGGDGGE